MVVAGQPIELNLPHPEAVATNVEVLFNVELPEIGTYWVEILLDDDLKLRYPLRVQQVVQRPPAQSG